MAQDHDPTDRQLDDEATEGEESPNPDRTADERTQQDAGLDGGVAEADEGERVGADDETG